MRWSPILVALLLAGCSSQAPDEPEEDEADFDEFDLEETKEEFGVIRGVVVDAAIRPLAGAVVSLSGSELNVTTKEAGTFAFKDLEPGPYFVNVVRPGYSQAQTSTEVVAGVKEPPVVRVMLERMPGTEPAVIPLQFDGHISCSARIPTGFATGCLLSIAVGDLGGDRMDFDVPEGNVHWMQTELTWEATAETAKSLCLRVYGYSTDDICGEDPVIQSVDQQAAQANDLGQGTPIEVVTYVDFFVEPVFGLALEQEFQAFTHVFYNFAPAAGWEFGRDGEPPVPS